MQRASLSESESPQPTEAILDNAQAAQEQFEHALKSSGLSMDDLRALAERIRRKLPKAEIDRVETATRALLPQERRRPGTSQMTLPRGIRG